MIVPSIFLAGFRPMVSLIFRIVFALISLVLRLAVALGALIGQILALAAMAGWRIWRRRQTERPARASAPQTAVALPVNAPRLARPRLAPERRYPTPPRPARRVDHVRH